MRGPKVRPKMDRPKVRENLSVPKDTAAMLKKQYEEQAREKQPKQKSPERYATDHVEGTAKGAALFAADRMRKAAKKQHQKRNDERKAQQYRTTPPPTEKEPQTGADDRADLPEEPRPAARGHEAQRPPLEYRTDSRRSADAPYVKGETNSPAPPSAKERGRRLAQTKYQTAKKQQAEARRWAVQTESRRTSAASAHPGETGAWRGTSATSLRGEQAAPASYAKEKISRKLLAEKKRQNYGANMRMGRESAIRPVYSGGARGSAMQPATGKLERFAPLRGRNTKTPGQQAKRSFQKKAQRELLQKSAEASRKAATAGGRAIAEVAVSVGRAAASVAGSLSAAGIGLVLAVLFLLVLAIGGLTGSPFGILFTGESAGPDAVPVSAAVAQVNFAFNAKLEDLQAGDYDSVTVAGSTADWVKVVAVFAVKTAGADTLDTMDVVTLDPNRVEKLEKVFLEMNVITTEVESIQHPGGADSAAWTERILHITIAPKTAAEVVEAYHFISQQQVMLKELLEQRELLEALIGDLFHISAEARDVLEQLPEDLSEERKAVIREACSLVGKVGYFWGGKSLTLGWDSRWGQLKQVIAPGSPTTGTYRPYGLDCSGFADWVFYNATQGTLVLGQGGGARMQHHACAPISWAEALPGDLVFYPDDVHVGIVCGRKENGELLIVHCASGANNVVITGKSGFVSIGRPRFYAA